MFKSTVERYKAAGYSKESIQRLEELESCLENLGDYLEEYRHLQPFEDLFSESIIGLIWELHALKRGIDDIYDRIGTLKSSCLDPKQSLETDEFRDELF